MDAAVDRRRLVVHVVTVAEDVEHERAMLADTLEAVGPHASAGCGDWTAFDLAAHIVAADRAAGTLAFCIRMLAARGVQFNPKPQVIAAAISRERRDGYPALLARLRQRSPRLLLAPPVAASTLFEVWMHHDDLTTSNGLAHGIPDHLALAIPPLVRYQAKHLPSRLIIRTRGHEWTFGPDIGGPSAVVLSGPAADLIRWLSGRGPTNRT
ncbi:maleylpyruvate isomerase family mycothiol-dependent enzyme [Mycolicibacterium iranicum]|uniref:Maleylpyruvate isomerase family mycothiol-dependent enzyme n=1 Tax=Mycolicibacterium iranicum TaxID=912594 RepID=A0ABT4HQ83_MYCIR|nr:maleylpyruvate isomerase family mycothiol-dependent enzyme [Mycolicibacterium iranicum]MCZ0732396.1 maleylpyruvate isomerase family mycothiol-dependent enzyme [Mycolicibacterium iranicum]